jgi:hypothetical protein
MRLCAVEGCETQHYAKGYCRTHYNQWKSYGDPTVRKRARRGSGSVTGGGYRQIARGVYEHRQVWEDAHGPLPPGWHVHHIDGNRLNNRLDNLVAIRHNDHARHHCSARLRDTDGRFR